MDALLAEIASKKSALNAEAGPSSGPAKKYMRRAEVEVAQEEAERLKKEEARERLRAEKEQRAAKKGQKDTQGGKNNLSRLAQVDSIGNTPEPEQGEKEHALSSSDLIRRLRARAQPIRLFGETDKARRTRLRALELGADERGQGGKADEFWRTLKGVENGLLERDAEVGSKKRKAVTGNGEEEGRGKKEEKNREVGEIDLPALKEDLNKAYPIVYWAFKNLYKEWEEWMEARPDDIKRSTQGKLALATHVQSGVNMKPLFKQLRSRDMPPDLIYKLAELVHFAQIRQYQRANDAYLRLSIGNAAWPIGVTSVGLHERGAREKITEDVVAHVLNDEVSRKWIQAVKRLLTFSQMVRPPADASQAMG